MKANFVSSPGAGCQAGPSAWTSWMIKARVRPRHPPPHSSAMQPQLVGSSVLYPGLRPAPAGASAPRGGSRGCAAFWIRPRASCAAGGARDPDRTPSGGSCWRPVPRPARGPARAVSSGPGPSRLQRESCCSSLRNAEPRRRGRKRWEITAPGEPGPRGKLRPNVNSASRAGSGSAQGPRRSRRQPLRVAAQFEGRMAKPRPPPPGKFGNRLAPGPRPAPPAKNSKKAKFCLLGS